MTTLRCTQKLLTALRVKFPSPAASWLKTACAVELEPVLPTQSITFQDYG
jgi:hypothetical protein